MYSKLVSHPEEVDEWKNIAVFQKFSTRLTRPVHFDTGDILLKVKLTCYGDAGIEHHTGTIIMINHGDKQGNIGLSSDFTTRGGEMFYLMIDIMRTSYTLGRSSSVLSIESQDQTLLNHFGRIDIEERFHEFVLWNN